MATTKIAHALDTNQVMGEFYDLPLSTELPPTSSVTFDPKDVSSLKWAVANSGRFGPIPTGQNLKATSEEELFLDGLYALATRLADHALASGTITTVAEYREFVAKYVTDFFVQPSLPQEEEAVHV